MAYLEANWGLPEINKVPTNGENLSGRLKNMQGVIIFHVPSWINGDENGNGGATGHVTLWNGMIGECSDTCYFGYDGLESISLWILKD